MRRRASGFDGSAVKGAPSDDFDAEALQRRHVRGVVAKEKDLADAEVGENLSADADLAQDALVLFLRAAFRAIGWTAFAMKLEASGGAVHAESALRMVQVN